MHKLIVISGPSGVGKSPLFKSLKYWYPEWFRKVQSVVLYNSRMPRPGEADGVDYHFRSRSQIEKLADKPDYIVKEVRGDLQALDINEANSKLQSRDIIFEGNPFIGRIFLNDERFKAEIRSMFISPLDAEEIQIFVKNGNIRQVIQEIMRRKLLRRTIHQKGNLALADYEEIERRSASAYEELCLASEFDYVIPNHDGEDSENWNAFYHPVGDARQCMMRVVDIISGNTLNTPQQFDPKNYRIE